MKIAILGAGGLGKAAAQIIEKKSSMTLVAVADAAGFIYDESAVRADELLRVKSDGSVGELKGGVKTEDSIGEVISLGKRVDGVFIALPNLPNEFIPGVVERFIDGGFQGAFSDALKRTQAMEMIFGMDEKMRAAKSTYLAGCGATPGLLTAAASLAAHSFIEIESVDIWWGVGIASWEEYKATIREDIAHLPGYDIERAKNLSDAEVNALLEETDGKLTLHEMEHADDVILEQAGVCSRKQVTVGGVMDTRSAKKPVSTTMTITGITFEGKRSSHRFILGDETSMAANVCGTALGYLKRAGWLRERGMHGVFSSSDMMPMMVP